MPDRHSADLAALFAALDARPEGLSRAEAAARLAATGPNVLNEAPPPRFAAVLLRQAASTMIVVLVVAALLSVVLGDVKDTVVILAIVVLNLLLGAVQEYRAERAMLALRSLAAPRARVRREGVVVDIPAAELVPGDVVVLEAGSLAPADCRLIEAVEVRADESLLTGESAPVAKSTAPVPPDAPLHDRHNLLHMGTLLTAGRATALVVATGMATELGRIAGHLEAMRQEPTPLQRRLEGMSRRLAGVALALVAVLVGMGLARGGAPGDLLLTALSMVVAAVPEGLPAVVTVTLALGAQRMLRRHVLIRRLPAVESLGSVTVICADKTGTLTENRMQVVTTLTAAAMLDPAAGGDPGVVLFAGALCNDATPLVGGGYGGDPTEVALAEAATTGGFERAAVERDFPRVAEVPFTSERRRMLTVHRAAGAAPTGLPATLSPGPGGHLGVAKGAADTLLDLAGSVLLDGAVHPLTRDLRAQLLARVDALAAEGQRVLALALAPWSGPLPENVGDLEVPLVFIGCAGIIDPPRPEARAAVQRCGEAGVRVLMITGDHSLTALAVAEAVRIASGGRVLSGSEIAAMSPGALEAALEETAVFARVAPEQKLRLVEALQRQGHIVAMTGDGVNDAPALRRADVGVAMGLRGTDVAKGAGDMVLIDDNFASIVAAVEEGRVIYDNVRKFLRYILTGNVGELGVMLLAPLLGMPLPLLPLQILWINLVTDGVPALALGLQPAGAGVMRRPPRPPSEDLLSRGLGADVLFTGALTAAVTLAVTFGYWLAGSAHWQTVAFTVLTCSQMGHALMIRHERSPGLRRLDDNPVLLASIAATLAAQLGILYVPPLQGVFETSALPWVDLLVVAATSAVVPAFVELRKALARP